MSDRYEKCCLEWDGVYKKLEVVIPNSADIGNKEVNEGLDWLCQDSNVILDFGCGNGSMLFYCAYRDTREHTGIDLSKEAIGLANKRARLMTRGSYDFITGGLEAIGKVEDESQDAIILSNVLDNLYPEDAILLIQEIKRILRPNGKLLVKLNPYITEEEIDEWKIKKITDDFLDDGLYLWNKTTKQWNELLNEHFSIEQYMIVDYEEHNLCNRLFLVSKK